MALASVSEIVVGSDRVDLYITFTDENDQPINIAGAQQVKVQGSSRDLPGTTIDMTGTIFDAAQGIGKFNAFGNAVTVANLGGSPHALYTLRGKLVDNVGETTFTPTFDVRFVHQPL